MYLYKVGTQSRVLIKQVSLFQVSFKRCSTLLVQDYIGISYKIQD